MLGFDVVTVDGSHFLLQGVNEERGICTVLRLIEIWDMAQ